MSTHPVLITIDLDDTLWPCMPVIRAAEEAHYRWLAQEAATLAAAHDIDSLRRHRQETAQRQPDIAHDFTAVRLASLQILLRDFGHPPELAHEATQVFLEARNHVAPFNDAAPVLERLQQRYTLASVTNGNADVHRTPLGPYIHLALSARSVGAAKPAPDIFLQALKHAGTVPARAVHVGDDPVLDMEAARRVGLRTVWVNRSGTAWPDELESPDAEVTDLHGLLAWLEQQP